MYHNPDTALWEWSPSLTNRWRPDNCSNPLFRKLPEICFSKEPLQSLGLLVLIKLYTRFLRTLLFLKPSGLEDLLSSTPQELGAKMMSMVPYCLASLLAVKFPPSFKMPSRWSCSLPSTHCAHHPENSKPPCPVHSKPEQLALTPSQL